MSAVICPKCKKELNDYEINKLWCTNCNAKFNSLSDLYNSNPEFQEKTERNQKILNDFVISTGYQFDGYNIDKYFNIVSSEVVLGTGLISELSAKVNDILGSTSEKLEKKLKDVKSLATQK